MGVDFFPCHYCQESICDCGHYIRCDCGMKWCSKQCAENEGHPGPNEDEEDSCYYCREQEVEDSLLIRFLLKRFNLSRDLAVQAYYRSLKKESQ